MKKTLIFVLSLVLSGLAFAEYNSSNIPDSAEIRRSCADSWFNCPVDQIRSQKEKFVKNNIGFQFQIRLEEDDKFYQIVVAPKSEISIDFNNNGVHRMEKADVYPKTACGSWVLYRDKKKGNCTKIVWYFNADSDVYLQLREENKKTFADLVVFGGFIARHVPVGITFEKACVSSFADIKRLTKTSLPWNKVQVLPGQYKDSVAMVYQIRKNLSSIIHVDDACYDEKGVLKSIFTQKPYNFAALEEKDADFKADIKRRHYLSNSGFLKWIIDGIVEPAFGRGTRIDAMGEPTVEFNPLSKNGVASQKWNLTFTLDWCRNLAASAYSAHTYRDVTYKTAGLDVNRNYFSSEVDGDGVRNSLGYIKNSGYEIRNLKSILYLLGIEEPGWFYLAAIRQPSQEKADDLVYKDCAVFFPYFDDAGRFGCFVFEGPREYSLNEFIANHSKSYVHLERVKSTQAFFLYEKR